MVSVTNSLPKVKMNYIIVWRCDGMGEADASTDKVTIELLADKDKAVERVDELINVYGEPGSDPCNLFLRVFFGHEIDLDLFEIDP